jgi:membrane fusion protein, multidrug efflux system
VRRQQWLVGGVIVLAMAAVAAAMLLRARSQADAEAKKKEAAANLVIEFTPAEVTRPLRTTLSEAIEFAGPLLAPRTAVVRAKAAGTLLSLTVAEGSRVQAGQVLGAIDLADLQSRVAERAANVDAFAARLAEAERAHAANESLARQQFISPTALESSRATLEAARAQLGAARAQLSTSRLGVREAGLVAPITGLVGKRSVLPGEKVSAEQELLTVVDLLVLELSGTVGSHQVAALAPGQPVAVRVEGQQQPGAGRIDRIAPVAEAGTRGIRVVVVLDNPGERWRAGQYASATVRLDDATPRLTVPLTAVVQASGQDFVWLLTPGASPADAATLARRSIVTGRRDAAGGRIEVQQGLDEGALLLAARFDNLRDGGKARVVERKSAEAAVAAASASAATAR